MGKLEDVSADRLRERLAEVEGAKAAKRLMVALCYLDGEPVSALSDRFGVPESTLYYWLDRFEDRPLADAIEDEPRPGRPSALDAAERRALSRDLAAPPSEHGYDADEWTPELAREHIESTYGVDYSVGHVRRLVAELTPDADA